MRCHNIAGISVVLGARIACLVVASACAHPGPVEPREPVLGEYRGATAAWLTPAERVGLDRVNIDGSEKSSPQERSYVALRWAYRFAAMALDANGRSEDAKRLIAIDVCRDWSWPGIEAAKDLGDVLAEAHAAVGSMSITDAPAEAIERAVVFKALAAAYAAARAGAERTAVVGGMIGMLADLVEVQQGRRESCPTPPKS